MRPRVIPDRGRLTRALSWLRRNGNIFATSRLYANRISVTSKVNYEPTTEPGSEILVDREKERRKDKRREGGGGEGKGEGDETTPTRVFRSRMEISFASFLRLIRRETEPRGRCRFADFGKGKQKGRNRKSGGDAEDAHGLHDGKEGTGRGCRGAARTGRRSVVVRITARRHRPIFLPPARTKRQLVSLLLREYRTFNLPTAVR